MDRVIPARTNILGLFLACILSVALIACGGKKSNNPTSTATGSGAVSAPTVATSAASPASRNAVVPATTPGATGPQPTVNPNDAIVSAGCGVTPDYGESVHFIQSGGLDRTYRLHVPRSYDPSRPTPLVLNFHGFGSNAVQQDLASGMPTKSESEGFILATPQGTSDPPRWYTTSPFELGYTDDVAFAKDLIAELSKSLCIDPKRIYATGISNGAGMASYLGCALNDEIAAVALVAGPPYSDLCRDRGPMPVVAFHGTGDLVVPFQGGVGGLYPVSVPESMKRWAEHNGCDMTLKTEEVASDVTREWYEGCTDGADAELYVIHGGGHTWPGSKIPLPLLLGNLTLPLLLGNTTHSISATDIIWDFFVAHPKP